MTIRVERTTPSGLKIDDKLCHQGLGFDKMFDCFLYNGLSINETRDKVFIKPKKVFSSSCVEDTYLITYSDTSQFAMRQIKLCQNCSYTFDNQDRFAGMYVVTGEGVIQSQNLGETFSKGSQFFLSATQDSISLINKGNKKIKVLFFYGPSC